jgi:MFS superfamily sulfate permease-like transporter
MFFYNRMKPVIAELSRWEDDHYRDAKHFNLKQCEHIAIIRFDGPLFFANISYLEDEVLKIVDSMPALKIVHFKSNGINDIDTSGDQALMLLVDRLHAAGFDVYFSGLKERIVDTMRDTGLLSKIGEDHVFPTLEMAIDAFWKDVHTSDEVETCPLKKVIAGGKE